MPLLNENSKHQTQNIEGWFAVRRFVKDTFGKRPDINAILFLIGMNEVGVYKEEWEKEMVTVLPMSLKQAGNMFEDNSDYFEELSVLELYVLENQSVNLLELREDYQLETVNNIWSEDTIDRLGRDHEVIKVVRSKRTAEILEIITDTLARLGMFS